jgi:predicted ArsR family transcriptional regulator
MSGADTSSAVIVSPGDPISVAVALGVPAVRIEILRFLKSQRATISEIAHAVGRTRYGMQTHLDVLERLGAVAHETEKVPGSFRPARRYRICRDGAEALAWCLFDAIADETPGGTL